ncbi:ABC transporter ATP-binding protein [Tardiphaga sp. 804_B3_N1_9]|uniref:ATP-binding cassette domain-containing protein n=1 Tax=Tardiphaga TaxID=1395974 RepID=UPI0015866ACC|nr:ABC transporter ATP-binding protein [Tardiphaga robiniae]
MTSKDWAIRAEGVSKKFGLTLRQSMNYGLRDIGARLLGRSNSETLREGEFWAVNDASFEVRGGQALGIMGVNGSGKTTLLRILNGVYAPDRGMVQMKGRVGALIAAGAGFAPMLTGRENVYVNGALLGLSTREIDGLMDEIVAFAELGQFIDLPVKNYSSGMYVRLGFAIAALSRPDVLLMDEVLAVGDMNFQKKCYDHILRLKRDGAAIILVSHSPGAIWSVCDRGLFMDKGKVLVEGPVEDVIRAYDDQNSRNAKTSAAQFEIAAGTHAGKIESDNEAGTSAEEVIPNSYGHNKGGTGDAICTNVVLRDVGTEQPKEEFGFGEPILITADVELKETQEDLLIRFTVDAVHYRFIVTVDNYEQGLEWKRVEAGRYSLRVVMKDPNFRPGAYTFNMGISRKTVGVHLFYWFGAARMVVLHPSDKFLYSDNNAIMFINSDFALEAVASGSIVGAPVA